MQFNGNTKKKFDRMKIGLREPFRSQEYGKFSFRPTYEGKWLEIGNFSLRDKSKIILRTAPKKSLKNYILKEEHSWELYRRSNDSTTSDSR